MQTEKATVTAQ